MTVILPAPGPLEVSLNTGKIQTTGPVGFCTSRMLIFIYV